MLLLRKHAVGGYISEINQIDLERVVFLSISTKSPLGKLRLVVELMGRHSNVILLDDQGTILDALRRVPSSRSYRRPILPKLTYSPPPVSGKLDWRQVNEDQLGILLSSSDTSTLLWLWIRNTFTGLGNWTCQELVYRAFGDTDITTAEAAADPGRLKAAFDWLSTLAGTGQWQPTVVMSRDGPTALFPFRPSMPVEGELVSMESMSRAVEAFYSHTKTLDRLSSLRSRVVQAITARKERAVRRLVHLQEALERTAQAELLNRQGQLILAYQWQVAPGDASLITEGMEIPLDPKLDPVRNALAKFEEARRLKLAAENLQAKIQEATAEVSYWEEQECLTQLADTAELLRKLGKEVSGPNPKNSAVSARVPGTLIRLKGGSTALIGRTAQENSALVARGSPNDLWFHAKGYPGAHIIVKVAGKKLTDEEISEVASYAAYFSGARHQTKAEVMVAELRHVRRLPGSPPGQVKVRKYRTLLVKPAPPH